MRSLLAFYHIVDSHDLFLSPPSVEEGRAHILSFLKDYSWLANDAVQKGQLKWQMTIKFHYLAHAAELLKWSNPKFCSTYPGEAFVGRVSKMALSSAMGKPSYSLGGLLMQKMQASRSACLRHQLS